VGNKGSSAILVGYVIICEEDDDEMSCIRSGSLSHSAIVEEWSGGDGCKISGRRALAGLEISGSAYLTLSFIIKRGFQIVLVFFLFLRGFPFQSILPPLVQLCLLVCFCFVCFVLFTVSGRRDISSLC